LGPFGGLENASEGIGMVLWVGTIGCLLPVVVWLIPVFVFAVFFMGKKKPVNRLAGNWAALCLVKHMKQILGMPQWVVAGQWLADFHSAC
jgi:hypothetical protein